MNWPAVPLGDVLLCTEYGTSAKASPAGTRPIIGMRNISNGVVDVSALAGVDDDPSLKRLIVQPGDVLLNRTNSPDLVGKVGIVRARSEAVFASYLVRLVPNPRTIDSEYLNAWLNAPAAQMRIRQLATRGVSQSNVNPTTLKRQLRIPVPPLHEQRRIAEVLRAWDDAIDVAQRQRDLADRRYSTTLEKSAGAGNHGATLRSGTRELSQRNANGSFDRPQVMGVSNVRGIVPMREQSIAQDLSRYQVLPPRAFAYNPMRIDVGSIAMSRLDTAVIVSPDYVLFECDETTLLPEYLDHVIKTKRWRHDVGAGASGSVRTRTYYDDLAAIRIHLPSLDTQRRITEMLDAMRAERTLLDRKIELLRTQKRGLLQKLLSGVIRVTAGTEHG